MPRNGTGGALIGAVVERLLVETVLDAVAAGLQGHRVADGRRQLHADRQPVDEGPVAPSPKSGEQVWHGSRNHEHIKVPVLASLPPDERADGPAAVDLIGGSLRRQLLHDGKHLACGHVR